jgi:hypothetical protein
MVALLGSRARLKRHHKRIEHALHVAALPLQLQQPPPLPLSSLGLPVVAFGAAVRMQYVNREAEARELASFEQAQPILQQPAPAQILGQILLQGPPLGECVSSECPGDQPVVALTHEANISYSKVRNCF